MEATLEWRRRCDDGPTRSNATYDVIIMTTRGRASFRLTGWSFFGGIALATVVVAVLTNLHDIRRYIKISTM
jgi:hypothetical protein